jgi:hypothetical protein
VQGLSNIRKLSLWIFIVPVVVLNLCLYISVNYEVLQGTIFEVDPIGQSGFTIPYIDGSLSISRSARTYPTYLLFKPGMIITSILLIKFWLEYNTFLKKLNNENNNKYFLYFGIFSAVFLIIHSILLGISFNIDLYKFFKRFVLLGFIIFEIIAQTLLVINIFKLKKEIGHLINKKILFIKMFLVFTLIVVALVSAPILNSSDYTHFKHALEWNYFLGVVSFYLLTFFFWKRA